MSARLLALALALLGSSGCMMLRTDRLADTRGWPPAAGAKPTLSYVLLGRVTGNGVDADMDGRELDDWQEELERVYVESGLFSRVTRGFAPADVHADVELEASVDVRYPLTYAAGLTLFVIPAVETRGYRVRTRFSDARGAPLGELEQRTGVRMWVQILLLPLAPFMGPHAVAPEAWRDANRATLVEARERKLF